MMQIISQCPNTDIWGHLKGPGQHRCFAGVRARHSMRHYARFSVCDWVTPPKRKQQTWKMAESNSSELQIEEAEADETGVVEETEEEEMGVVVEGANAKVWIEMLYI